MANITANVPQVLLKPGATATGPTVVNSSQPTFGSLTPAIGGVFPSQTPQANSGGIGAGTVVPYTGLWKTPVIDAAAMSMVGFQVDYQHIKGQAGTGSAALLGNIATPASWQLEGSLDGLAFLKLTATNAPGVVNTNTITQAVESSLWQVPLNKPGYRYFQARLVPAGAAAVYAAAMTAPATLPQNGTSVCFTPDGLVMFYGTSTTPYLEAFNLSSLTATTVVFSVNVAATALTVTTATDMDCIGPFTVNGVAQYYVAIAGAATPYNVIAIYSVAGGFSAYQAYPALAGAALAVKWVPGISNAAAQIVFFGFTGGTGMAAYSYNASTGGLGVILTTATSTSGSSLPAVGANVSAIDISKDGSILITGESSTPFTHMFSLNANAAGGSTAPITGYAANPMALPAAAIISVSISPHGEAVVLALGATVESYQIFRTNPTGNAPTASTGNALGSFSNNQFVNYTTNPLGLIWGGQQQITTVTLGNATWVVHHPNGSLVTVGTVTGTPFEKSYPVQDFITGYLGTAETAPTAITNATACLQVKWHPSGAYLASANTSSAAAGSAGAKAYLFDANVGCTFFGSNYV